MTTCLAARSGTQTDRETRTQAYRQTDRHSAHLLDELYRVVTAGRGVRSSELTQAAIPSADAQLQQITILQQSFL